MPLQFSLPDILMLIGFLLVLGGFAGFMAGLLGVGGGLILVPGLYYIFASLHDRIPFDMAHLMHICVGTSLAIIVPTGLSSAMAHHRKGAVQFDMVKTIGVGVVIGVAGATFLARGLDVMTMKMIFATAMMLLGLLMLSNPARIQIKDHMPKQPYPGIAGVGIGGLSTLIGIGGATISVPFMTMHGVKIHTAVGTASAIGLVISIPAALGYMMIGWDKVNLPPASIGYVNLLAWGCIIPASIIAAPFGAHVAHKVSVSVLRRIFACFVIVVALDMWRKILFAG